MDIIYLGYKRTQVVIRRRNDRSTLHSVTLEATPDDRTVARRAVEDAIKNGICLDWADLSGLDLSGGQLSEGSFVDSDWRGTYCYRTNLDGARMRGVVARGAVFLESSLREAMIDEMRAQGAVFDGSDMELVSARGALCDGASLREVKLDRSTWVGAKLRGVDTSMARGVEALRGASVVDLSEETQTRELQFEPAM